LRYIRQFSIILFITFCGELLRFLIPLPIPAGIYGLLLMLLALGTGTIRPDSVKGAGNFLIEIMPVMFIPAAAGLLESWGVLAPIWVPVMTITVVSTVLVMAVSGLVAQWSIRRGKAEEKR